MITFEEAFEIAKKNKKDIDICTEYENGYVFGYRADDNYDGGRGHTPCVVMKKDGKVIPMNAFVIKGTGKEIRSFEI